MGVYIMNTLMVKIIAYKLDYHWYFLKKYEKRMQQLYEKGVGLSDGKILSLNEKFLLKIQVLPKQSHALTNSHPAVDE